MQPKLNTNEQNHGKFRDAEHLWFWFISSRKIRCNYNQKNNDSGNRPCELLDVETLVSKLYLSGKISKEQLIVIKEWGEKRRCPNQHVYAENSAAYLWLDTMRILQAAFKNKDWLI